MPDNRGTRPAHAAPSRPDAATAATSGELADTTPSSLNRVVMWILAAPMAAIAASLTGFIVMLLRIDVVLDDIPDEGDTVAPVAALLAFGFALYVLLRGAREVLTVLLRGFALGTLQWLLVLMLIQDVDYELRGSPSAPGQPPRASWEPGPLPVVDPDAPYDFVMFMALVCAIGCVVAFSLRRWLRDSEDPSRTPP